MIPMYFYPSRIFNAGLVIVVLLLIYYILEAYFFPYVEWILYYTVDYFIIMLLSLTITCKMILML